MEMTYILELTFWSVSTFFPSLKIGWHWVAQRFPPPFPFPLSGVSSMRIITSSISSLCLMSWGPSYRTGLRNVDIQTNALVMIPKFWWSWRLQILLEQTAASQPSPKRYWHWICMYNKFPDDVDVAGLGPHFENH